MHPLFLNDTGVPWEIHNSNCILTVDEDKISNVEICALSNPSLVVARSSEQMKKRSNSLMCPMRNGIGMCTPTKRIPPWSIMFVAQGDQQCEPEKDRV